MTASGGGFWSMGFRPFFLFAALHAAFALALWLFMLSGALVLPSGLDPLAWHRHEMLFGVIGGVMAGFLLTAVPNWTGRPPLAGRGLIGLFSLWAVARLCAILATGLAARLSLFAEILFFLSLAAWAAHQIRLAGNRNLPIALMIAVFGLAAASDRLLAMRGAQDAADMAYRFGFAIVLMLILMIGGRIIPAFTRNWLVANGRVAGMPDSRPAFEMALRIVHAASLLGWAVFPDAAAVQYAFIALGIFHLVRLAGWRGESTLAEPLLFILHVAYLWMPLGLLLLGLSGLGLSIPAAAALHALSAGLMGSMTLAVMMRASLGHGGRPLKATPLTNLVFLSVTAGALLRLVAPLLPMPYIPLLIVSAVLWGGAYLLFALGFLPLFLARRP